MLNRLQTELERIGPFVIAFSGGLDSAVLAAAAKRFNIPVRLIHVSTFLQTTREYRMMKRVAKLLDLPFQSIAVDIRDADFLKANPPNRCYYCKTKLFSTILANTPEGWRVADGTQADDDESDRPGSKAVKELGIESPLKNAGLGKADLRRLAEAWGLPNAHTPSASCLATRIPFGEPVTKENTAIIDRAEEAMIALGIENIRMRMERK